MIVRPAVSADAVAMSHVLSEILQSWQSDRPGDPGHVLAHYVEHPDSVACTVAIAADGNLKGFQSLKIARPENDYDVPAGWGVIGTYVKLCSGRSGIGKLLFTRTLDAARQAGLTKIDATIGKSNFSGRGYYSAMGFRTWRDLPTATGKCLTLVPG
ncbi:GNAT family N-acetyltransferase [Labrenzia sp. VG12]|nr:GNAT family N-acetyltransferase [Labrenzia sp. VG12]